MRSSNFCPLEHTFGEMHENKSKYTTGFIRTMKEVGGLGSATKWKGYFTWILKMSRYLVGVKGTVVRGVDSR